MNDKVYKFEAEIKKVPGIDGAYVEFPYDLKKEFGKGRLKVHAEFDGEPYDGVYAVHNIKLSCLFSYVQILAQRVFPPSKIFPCIKFDVGKGFSFHQRIHKIPKPQNLSGN